MNSHHTISDDQDEYNYHLKPTPTESSICNTGKHVVFNNVIETHVYDQVSVYGNDWLSDATHFAMRCSKMNNILSPLLEKMIIQQKSVVEPWRVP